MPRAPVTVSYNEKPGRGMSTFWPGLASAAGESTPAARAQARQRTVDGNVDGAGAAAGQHNIVGCERVLRGGVELGDSLTRRRVACTQICLL